MIDDASHLRTRYLPEFLSHGLSVLPVAHKFEHLRPFLGKLSEVTGWVSDNLHWLDLLRESLSAVKERRFDIVNQQHDTAVLQLDVVAVVDCAFVVSQFDCTTRNHAIHLPLVVVRRVHGFSRNRLLQSHLPEMSISLLSSLLLETD